MRELRSRWGANLVDVAFSPDDRYQRFVTAEEEAQNGGSTENGGGCTKHGGATPQNGGSTKVGGRMEESGDTEQGGSSEEVFLLEPSAERLRFSEFLDLLEANARAGRVECVAVQQSRAKSLSEFEVWLPPVEQMQRAAWCD